MQDNDEDVLIHHLVDRVLRAHHRSERHGGSDVVTPSLLEELFAGLTRQAFAEADPLPDDAEVLGAVDDELDLLGEGYHMIALAEPARRFVVKYAKAPSGIPPLASDDLLPQREHWASDHAVTSDGRLHPAIWEHIRAFEAYGTLTVPNRVYIAADVWDVLDVEERRALERFVPPGIVRSLGEHPRALRPRYPPDFPQAKRPEEGIVAVSVMVVQPTVTPLTDAMRNDLLAGDPERARYWEDSYRDFLHELWSHGISHLDFSMLNVGVFDTGSDQRLVVFDPHMGAIELSPEGTEIADPFSAAPVSERSLDQLLRTARDGSRWALWRIERSAAEAPEVPDERVSEAADIVREFHRETADVANGTGTFSRSRFQEQWRRRDLWDINELARTQLAELVRHPLFSHLHALVGTPPPDEVYDRALPVRGADGSDLQHFRARLQVYDQRPLLLVTNITDTSPGLTKHWGRVWLPPELDIQDDPAIHYHLRDLLTGEVYVRSGEELARNGLAVGLAPFELHALQVEDTWVQDLALERALAVTPDMTALLEQCKKTLAAVGDVHGEYPALTEILRALGFIDGSDHWSADDATLVLTGDVGHGEHLQETFDLIRRLAAQAHTVGGQIVWTLGNHDLYADKEGGQGGERSLGYQLWPQVRELALHPERSVGLTVTAAFHHHGKVFVHGGVLPDVVQMAGRACGTREAAAVVDYVNQEFRKAIATHDRLHAGDEPHEIFRTGTSHAAQRRLPGEPGYEPAGIFTPDLRELDHYRRHDRLLPQIVGHTASERGAIRYAPGSRLHRDYIAIDVGRQHGLGNGGLFLTELGWMAVEPDEPTRLVEASTLFAQLAREAVRTEQEGWSDQERAEHLVRTVAQHLHPRGAGGQALGDRREQLYGGLPPDDVLTLTDWFASIAADGRCVLVTDLDDTLTTFLAHDTGSGAPERLVGFLAAGGGIVFDTATPFDWFHERVLGPLVSHLGDRRHLLRHVALILSGGAEIYLHEDDAYRLVDARRGRGRAEALVQLLHHPRSAGRPWHHLDARRLVHLADSYAPTGIDGGLGAAVGFVVNLGEPLAGAPYRVLDVMGGYRRAADLLALATAALRDSGLARPPTPTAAPRDVAAWTFADKHVSPGRRVRVRVGASGFVHAGATRPDGRWDPVFDIPLSRAGDGAYEALLPEAVDAFTFFWTEPPRTPGHPGHWEREPHGGRVFHVVPASVLEQLTRDGGVRPRQSRQPQS